MFCCVLYHESCFYNMDNKLQYHVIKSHVSYKRLSAGPSPQPIGFRAFYFVDGGFTNVISDETYERDNYPFYTFEYVTRGNGQVEVDGTRYAINTGDVYILPAKRHHIYWPEDPWRKYYFVTQGPLMENLLSSYNLSKRYHFPQATGVKEIFKTISQWRNWPKKESLHDTVAVFAHRIIMHLSRLPVANTGLSQRIARIKSLLDENPEQGVSLKTLAGSEKMSRQHLIRLFKSELGISPHHYLLNRKMELARRMLAEWELTVSETAYRLGFYDPYHFSRMFKRLVGVPPSRVAAGASADISHRGSFGRRRAGKMLREK